MPMPVRPQSAPAGGRPASGGWPGSNALPAALTPKKLATQEDLDRNLQRLYQMPVDKERKRRQKDDQEIVENRERNTTVRCRKSAGAELSQREQDFADKLYYKAVQRRVENGKRLAKKFDDGLSWRKRQLDQARLTDEHVTEMAVRLSHTSIIQRAKKIADLDRKFYPSADLKFPHSTTKLDEEQVKEVAHRLSGGSMADRREKLQVLERKHAFRPRAVKRIDMRRPSVQQRWADLAQPKIRGGK